MLMSPIRLLVLGPNADSVPQQLGDYTAPQRRGRVLGGTFWPRVRELRGFHHVELAPGETAEVSFTIGARTLASVSRSGEHEVEPGEFAIETGPSSGRTQSAGLTVHPSR
ncbi:fibronectin type III-like domain-contianing protein [Streptomyces albidoflavus]